MAGDLIARYADLRLLWIASACRSLPGRLTQCQRLPAFPCRRPVPDAFEPAILWPGQHSRL